MTRISKKKTTSKPTSRWITAVQVVLAAYCIVVVPLMLTQDEWLYNTHPRERPKAPEFYAAPQFGEVVVNTPDGLALNAWYEPPADDETPVMLVLHGNSGHVGAVMNKMRPMVAGDLPAGFLLLDYREYGGNPGTATQEGLFTDARAAMKFLQDKGVGFERVILYGESMGTAVAAKMASEFPVAAVILQAGFDNRALSIAERFPYLWPLYWMIRDDMDSRSWIGDTDAPVLFLHGTNDTKVDIESGRALYEAAHGQKSFVAINGGGHDDLFDFPETMQAIRAFLAAQGLMPLNDGPDNDDYIVTKDGNEDAKDE